MNIGLLLTPERARELIAELERRLTLKGVHASIRIAGGAAMVLRFPDDPDVRVTTDVDAAYEPAWRSTRSSLRWHATTVCRIAG